MTPYLPLILLSSFTLFSSCGGNAHDAKRLGGFGLFLDKANNDSLSLPDRLAAAQDACLLASQLNDIPKQIESNRTKGVLYWEMDSLEQAMSAFSESAKLARTIDDKKNAGHGIEQHRIDLERSLRLRQRSSLL